jgi:hypothetical protein
MPNYNLEDLIQNEFIRLSVDANTETPYSGLICCKINVVTNENISPVTVFDEYTSVIHNGEQLLQILRAMPMASLEPDSDFNIWDLISGSEI